MAGDSRIDTLPDGLQSLMNRNIMAEGKALMNFVKRIVALSSIIFSLIVLPACQTVAKPPAQEPMKKPSESFLKYGETNMRRRGCSYRRTVWWL